MVGPDIVCSENIGGFKFGGDAMRQVGAIFASSAGKQNWRILIWWFEV